MKNGITVIAFSLAAVLCTAMFLLPADKESVYSENRTPAEILPATEENLKSGKWAESFEDYLGDNVGFRSELTKASDAIENLRGIDSGLGKIVSVNKDIGTATVQKSSLLVADGAVMEMFVKNEAAEKKYVEMINYLAEKLTGVKVYSMIIPTQLEFREPVYANLQDSQKKTIDDIYSRLNSSVTAVNVYDTLAAHTDEYIYFRTDHHWTARGAYYGCNAFLEASGGKRTVDIGEPKKNEIRNFYGYLSKQAPGSDVNADTIEWYETDADSDIEIVNSGIKDGKKTEYKGTLFDRDKKNYSLFMSGDQPFSVITNHSVQGGKTIMILKDSYANAFIPWLIGSYSRIILMDPRNCVDNINYVLKEYAPEECLIMNYIFTTTFEDYSNAAKNLMK